LVALTLALAPVALAAPAGGTWLGVPRWIFLVLNLAIFLGLIFKFAVPKVIAFLDQRSAAIGESLELAKRQEAEVAGLERRLSEGLASIEEEIRALSVKAELDAAREREEILASAEVQKERVLAQAHAEMDQRVEQARAELTRHAAELAAQLASQKLAGELDEPTRAELFRDGLARLERKNA
jgi:F-type H+-transporting ATPase subunit b